jgi:pimeloyl-ACP methyl ester carboxylesterase
VLKARALVASAVLPLLAVTCGGNPAGDGGPADTPPESTRATHTASAAGSHELTQRQVIAGAEAVHFRSADGDRLAGRLFGHGKTAVILSHMGPFGQDQTEWWPTAHELAKNGYTVLTYDYSGICPGGGAGCSDGRTSVSEPAPNLLGAISYVRSRGADRIVLGGASMGAMASLKVAARPDVHAAGVISLSGVEAFSGPYELGRDVIIRIEEPKLFVAGDGDEEAADAARDWIRWSPPPKMGKILDTGLHGTDMITLASGGDAEIPDKVTTLIRSFLDRFAPARSA